MNEYWFYTLSAIPQTLAAMIALAATFVIYKLSLLETRINEFRAKMTRYSLLLTSSRQGEIHQVEELTHTEYLLWLQEGFNALKENDSNLGLGFGMYERFKTEMERVIREEYRSGFEAEPKRIYDLLKQRINFLNKTLEARNQSFLLLRLSIISVAFVIIVALFFLPNISFFHGSLCWVLVIVGMSVLSILQTVWTVFKVARI